MVSALRQHEHFSALSKCLGDSGGNGVCANFVLCQMTEDILDTNIAWQLNCRFEIMLRD